MRVLVVDDDVVVHMTLELALDDVEIVEAFNVREGFTLGVAGTTDGFVIDRRVSGGDGLDLVRRFRRHLRTNRTPIIVLTAAYDPADEAMVLQAGADVWLPKPFDPESVRSHLRSLLDVPPGQRRERRQHQISRLHLAPDPLVVPLDVATTEEDKRGWRHLRRVGDRDDERLRLVGGRA